MADTEQFRKIIDEDLTRLKILLKSKVASFDEIKEEEEQMIEAIKNVMTQVKEMEEVLENEILLFKRLASGWEKAYIDRRWGAIGNAIRGELEDFNNEYSKTKDVYDKCNSLNERLQKLLGLLKSMNAKNKESREKELKMLEDFRQRKREVSGI
mgnify:CR=1 FL=1